MFSKQDIAILKGMFETNNDSLVRRMRDEMDARFAASENRLRKEILQVKTDVLELLDSAFLPQISDLDHRVTRIEQHPKLA